MSSEKALYQFGNVVNEYINDYNATSLQSFRPINLTYSNNDFIS